MITCNIGFITFATLLPHESQEHLIKKDIHVITADVTSDSDTEKLIAELDLVCKGRLDVLINNASVSPIAPSFRSLTLTDGSGICISDALLEVIRKTNKLLNQAIPCQQRIPMSSKLKRCLP